MMLTEYFLNLYYQVKNYKVFRSRRFQNLPLNFYMEFNDLFVQVYKIPYQEAIKSSFSIGNGVMKITFDLTLHWVHSPIFTSGHNLKYTVYVQCKFKSIFRGEPKRKGTR